MCFVFLVEICQESYLSFAILPSFFFFFIAERFYSFDLAVIYLREKKKKRVFIEGARNNVSLTAATNVRLNMLE